MPGHESALLQLRQLQSELEVLRGLRAVETAAQEDLLRLPSTLHVSPTSSAAPGQWPLGGGCAA